MRRFLLGVAVLFVLVLVALLVAHWTFFIVHASQETGTSNEASRGYAFWSGFGSDLGEATLITAVLAGIWGAYRKANCHSKGCPWLAHHEYDIDGVKYKLCRVCHPEVDHQNRLRRHHFHAHHEQKCLTDPREISNA